VLVYVGVALVVAVATSAQVVSGFGFSLVAIPLVAVLAGAKSAVVGTAMVGPLLTAAVVLRDRGHIRWRSATTITAAALVGMPAGIFVLSHASDRGLTAIIGVIVVAAGLALWRGLRVPGGRRSELIAGLVSGALATSTGTNGPPLVIVLHSESLEPRQFRGTLSASFLAQGIVAIFAFWISGHLTADAARVAGSALPGLGIGWIVGERLFKGMETERFRAIVLVMLVASGLVSAVSALAR
jgi:uncharacterized membrane protein YfcA